MTFTNGMRIRASKNQKVTISIDKELIIDGTKAIARDACIPEKSTINDPPPKTSKKNFSNGVIKVTVKYDLTDHEDFIDIVGSHIINSQRCLVQLAGYNRRWALARYR
ncbi:hypothetical protein BpHYR1_043025 [Brachionus plicatilis]|uniref:Uncharacterized protein n=1 Tax=Brachionus plicatilis TaxID=10195 RepID=A0A3M7SG99_BRAPC|nr:hypothetical protein BpHYR1_043025 [Brachionus plicatilis]